MNLTAENHRIALRDGNQIPLLGLGTYGDPRKTPKGIALDCVKQAIDVGYRHFDGALVYFNEHEVGQAIREKIADGTVRREDIFYCGKLWNTFHPPKLVRPTLEKTLKALKLDYVDLYIIELPMAFKPGNDFYPKDQDGKYIYHHTDLCATWEALEACVDAGLVKSLGVSNFNRRQLELILNKPGLKHKPVSNQVECHPYFTQPKLLEYCRQNDIVIVGYCPLGSSRDASWYVQRCFIASTNMNMSGEKAGCHRSLVLFSTDHASFVSCIFRNRVNLKCPPMLEDELLVSIGKKYNKSSAQVALRFNVQRGVVVIPKSFNPQRIKHNFQIFDFSLTEEEMKAIEGLNKNIRFVELLMWSDHPEYPFHDEY
ncbi:aldo-keto reductase family 1 member D1-like isoform X1 [Syngnathus scovelli]|uniref:aldo-keto reductase family 1 member D1-like isoform X1 n=1 Tax=Syngnathus scovelli TaxID=161590 RepID=UPI0021101EB5|nr:aldo-keto reductase family 1 member D1-like isoform X1 [Syngnathus scovelli]